MKQIQGKHQLKQSGLKFRGVPSPVLAEHPHPMHTLCSSCLDHRAAFLLISINASTTLCSVYYPLTGPCQ